MASILVNAWESFFFSRAGTNGCRIAGYIRIGFALMFLIDRILLLFHLDHFFSPDHGVLPYRISGKNYELVQYHQWSVFQYAPESELFVWIVAGVGIVQGFMLLLGTAKSPRLNLFFIYLNMLSFLNHDKILWDGEDDMFRIWCFLLLFFPLDVCTVYDRFGFRPALSEKDISWPMWPFRIFQIEVGIIYMGASLGKLAEPFWQDGSSIYRLTYGSGDYPGVFNPDYIFGRYGPLKLLCWSSLILESVSWIAVWFPALRNEAVAMMISLHIGIDLSMQMHMFEWLSCLGWLVFLIQPDDATIETDCNEKVGKGKNIGKNDQKMDIKKTNPLPIESKSSNEVKPSGTLFKKSLINIFIIAFLSVITLDAMPFRYMHPFLPKSIHPFLNRFIKQKKKFFEECIEVPITAIGLSQDGDWSMYTNVVATVSTYRLDATFDNGTSTTIWQSPDWSDMSSWTLKYHIRQINYFGLVAENYAELAHLIEVTSKPFLVPENSINTLTYFRTERIHEEHTMRSTGGFWDPVVKYPMDIVTEEKIMRIARVGDCKDSKSQECYGSKAFEVLSWQPPDDDNDADIYGEEEEDNGDDDEDESSQRRDDL